MSSDRQPDAGVAPLEVFVYYDFASSLSYVAHRVLGRIDDALAEERVVLRWKPIDLTGIGSFQRGRLLEPERRRSLIEVAAALDVSLDPPARWPDSRLAGEIAVTLDLAIDRGLETAVELEWRKEVFGALFEQGGEEPEARIELLFREFERRGHFGRHGFASLDELAAGRRLAAATGSAASAGVEGVPTLMLDAFPLCGIHDEGTMLGMIQRYARRRRGLEAQASVAVN